LTHSLIWHPATYVKEFDSNGFPPPHLHRLISLAGLSVEWWDTTPPVVRLWATLRNDPTPLLQRFDAELATADEMVTLSGVRFGLPVLRCNALSQSVVMENFVHKPHFDLAEEIGGGFDVLTKVFGLPARARLDVKAAWDNKKHRAMIAKRLMCDCTLIALAYGRYQRMRGVLPSEHYELYEQAVLDAAAEKTKWVRKAFNHE